MRNKKATAQTGQKPSVDAGLMALASITDEFFLWESVDDTTEDLLTLLCFALESPAMDEASPTERSSSAFMVTRIMRLLRELHNANKKLQRHKLWAQGVNITPRTAL